ncbi:MAG: sialidase family protein [Planctomycetota bacterium]|nr:sialidase family protein [Planctomycetota bacterium]
MRSHVTNLFRIGFLVIFLLAGASIASASEAPNIRLLRVPNGGIQPQVLVGSEGKVHMVYFAGHPMQGDIYYVASADGGETFSEPLRVNSQEGSASISISFDLGKDDRVHVAWNGSPIAEPKALTDSTPLLYSRLNDDGSAFEPQRNVIREHPHLDGGSSVSADDQGNVYVVWHAPEKGGHGEEGRVIWVSRSGDEGKTFETESNALPQSTGACACCALQSYTDQAGTLYVMYRMAWKVTTRDMQMLMSKDQGKTFTNAKIDPWEIGQCMMSTSSMAQQDQDVYAAWETKNQVYFGRLDSKTGEVAAPIAAPDKPKMRKHPHLVTGTDGAMLLVWTEGLFWGRGGTLAWQIFDADGTPMLEENGGQAGVPAYSTVAAFASPDGFTIVY